MNPFETSITENITRLKMVTQHIKALESEKKMLEITISRHFKENDISEFENCYIGFTTIKKAPNFNEFELKTGVDPEKITVKVPISWIEFKKLDSNGNEIDLSKIKVEIPATFEEKYPQYFGKSESLKIRKGEQND